MHEQAGTGRLGKLGRLQLKLRSDAGTKVLEPFRKVVESDESVVIQGAVGGHREGFGIRAI